MKIEKKNWKLKIENRKSKRKFLKLKSENQSPKIKSQKSRPETKTPEMLKTAWLSEARKDTKLDSYCMGHALNAPHSIWAMRMIIEEEIKKRFQNLKLKKIEVKKYLSWTKFKSEILSIIHYRSVVIPVSNEPQYYSMIIKEEKSKKKFQDFNLKKIKIRKIKVWKV